MTANIWRVAIAAITLLGGGLLAGCRTYIPITRYEPGRVAIGAADTLVLVEAKGRSSVRRDVLYSIDGAVERNRYFKFRDRSGDGGQVRIGRNRVTIDRGPKLKPNELGFLLEVYQATIQEGVREERHREREATTDGTTGRMVDVVTTIPVWDAEVVIGITLFNAKGDAKLTEHEYVGEYVADADNTARNDATAGAAAAAIDKFLRDVTPRQVREHVMVDRSDDRQGPIIQSAAAGNLERAAEEMKAYYESDSGNAAAAYNLAVFTEALGDYDTALKYYDEAISLEAKGFFYTARDQCERRKRQADKLKDD